MRQAVCQRTLLHYCFSSPYMRWSSRRNPINQLVYIVCVISQNAIVSTTGYVRSQLLFAFLCATSQTKVLTLDGTLDFYKNLVGQKTTKSDRLEENKRKDSTVSKPKEYSNQALTSEMDGDKYTQVKENMSLSRFFISK